MDKRTACFHTAEPPRVTLHDYAVRIHRYFECSDECFVLSLIYIDRILKSNPGFKLGALNSHRLLLTSTVVAVKFHDDDHLTNQHYAQVGSVRIKDFNKMEVEFLKLLDWRVHVNPQEFEDNSTQLAILQKVRKSVNTRCDNQQIYTGAIFGGCLEGVLLIGRLAFGMPCNMVPDLSMGPLAKSKELREDDMIGRSALTHVVTDLPCNFSEAPCSTRKSLSSSCNVVSEPALNEPRPTCQSTLTLVNPGLEWSCLCTGWPPASLQMGMRSRNRRIAARVSRGPRGLRHSCRGYGWVGFQRWSGEDMRQ